MRRDFDEVRAGRADDGCYVRKQEASADVMWVGGEVCKGVGAGGGGGAPK